MKYIKKFNESREELISEEGKNFLDIVRQKLPEKVNRYMSLIVNKGLSVAIEDFKINDPDEIKRKEKERIKKEKENILRLKKENKLTDYYFDFLVDRYLKTNDWKEWIKNNGYPDIGNYPTFFNSKVGLKKEKYEIEYKVENPIYSHIKFLVSKYDNKIDISCRYEVSLLNFEGTLFITRINLSYDNTDLESSIIDFFSILKQDFFISSLITLQDVKNIEIFALNLKNEIFVSSYENISERDFLFKFKPISDNDEFNFLQLPLSHYYYDGTYIYMSIMGKYFFKFHEQYAHKVYKLYKKTS